MERWGTLAVADHLDARALATEVLVYDRLIMPRPTQGDYQRWKSKGWKPDRLLNRMDQLGEDISYPESWSTARRTDWHENWDRLTGLAHDANGLRQVLTEEDAMMLSRMRLAMGFARVSRRSGSSRR